MTGTTLGSRSEVPLAIARTGVIAIGRRLPPESVGSIAEALVRGGVGAFEITLDGPNALVEIGALARRFDTDRQLLVGAGTVLDAGSARRAVEAGARFLVTPHLDGAVIRTAVALGIPVFPGAFSPTEIVAAWGAGATAVKLFPASAVGPAFVRELSGPFREIPLVPTGGVTIESAAAFVAAGAVACGLGGALIGEGDPALIEDRALRLVEAIGLARAGVAAVRESDA
jgi:2-dehydro-3-deoxyphosphogluconate aldolase / (4S)-4-hydroxy-2-oxoglutarate aldolase